MRRSLILLLFFGCAYGNYCIRDFPNSRFVFRREKMFGWETGLINQRFRDTLRYTKINYYYGGRQDSTVTIVKEIDNWHPPRRMSGVDSMYLVLNDFMTTEIDGFMIRFFDADFSAAIFGILSFPDTLIWQHSTTRSTALNLKEH